MFPSYPWNYNVQDSSNVIDFFKGDVPDNWRRFSASSEWIYPLDLFPSLVWYLRNLKWPSYASDDTISFIELALDFQAATHVYLHQSGEDINAVDAERQARLFSSARKMVGQICKSAVLPGVDNARKRDRFTVGVLTSLGLGKAGGLLQRPILMVPAVVHKIYCKAAMETN